jgi:hypothetical protein
VSELLEQAALGIRLLADTWAHFGGELNHSSHCWIYSESATVLECECGLSDLEEAIENLCRIASEATRPTTERTAA